MILHCTHLQVQALLILKNFAVHAYLAHAVNISKTLGDLAGILACGNLLIVKLKETAERTCLSCEQIEKMFERDVLIMRFASPVTAIKKELWVARADGAWQFFEIFPSEIREVRHDP